MRAAVHHQPGEPPRYADHPTPTVIGGHTLVRVTAAPLVPLDLLCSSGTSYFGVPAMPYVPGVQGVGIVEQSEQLRLGTRVWFSTSAGMVPGDGGLAEFCSVADDDVVPIEADVPDSLAAALGLSAIAAWMALSSRGALRPGENVLILGGGGAVGQAGIGAARALGAAHVVAIARSDSAQERARSAGADAVVPFTSDVEDLTSRIEDCGVGRFDVVLDPVFGAAATAASRVLAEGGRLVNLGGASGDEAVFSSSVLRSRSASVLGYTNNALTPADRRAALSSIFELAAAGAMTVEHATTPLATIEEQWLLLAGGKADVRQVFEP